MKRLSGMTMVEVLITLVLITLTIGGIFGAIRMGTTTVYRGGDETLATMYASEILETIRGAPFRAFPANGQPMNPEQIFNEHNIPEGVDIANYQERFSIEATVSEVEGYSPNKIKQIKVVVSWKDRVNAAIPKNSVLITFYTPAVK